jgi:hypothetical protein
VIRVLELRRDQYGAVVDLTRRMLDHPDFKRLQGAIARALARVPRLEAEDVEALCKALRFPNPTKTGGSMKLEYKSFPTRFTFNDEFGITHEFGTTGSADGSPVQLKRLVEIPGSELKRSRPVEIKTFEC